MLSQGGGKGLVGQGWDNHNPWSEAYLVGAPPHEIGPGFRITPGQRLVGQGGTTLWDSWGGYVVPPLVPGRGKEAMKWKSLEDIERG